MIQAIALDDEPHALDILSCFCNESSSIELVATFSNTNKALVYLKKHPVDVLFIDINMPAISGIEFIKKIPRPISVIFTSAYSEYAIEGFNLSAVDFLLKPFSFSRFEQAVTKVTHQFELQNASSKQDFIFIRADYSLVKVSLEEILYIESMGDYVKIFILNKKTIISKISLKSIMTRLPLNNFIRVHRSYVIPLAKVENVKNKYICIQGKEIPLGVSYEAAFFTRFKV